MTARKQVDGWRDVLTATGRGRVLARVQQQQSANANELRQTNFPKGHNMKTGRIVVYQRADRQWGFRVVAANGEIVAQSEGYKGGKRAAVRGARAVVSAIASAVPVIGA